MAGRVCRCASDTGPFFLTEEGLKEFEENYRAELESANKEAILVATAVMKVPLVGTDKKTINSEKNQQNKGVRFTVNAEQVQASDTNATTPSESAVAKTGPQQESDSSKGTTSSPNISPLQSEAPSTPLEHQQPVTPPSSQPEP